MYDHNVFAVLTAHDEKNRASSAIKLEENAKWFHKAMGGVAEKPTITSREATPAETSPQGNSETAETDAVNRLVITFDKLLENIQHGLQLGTNPKSSHVLLGHRGTRGISAKQCNITVDNDLRIWLHDYYSTHGTAVGYDGQNQKEVRRKETWILADRPKEEDLFMDITIHSSSLALKIIFPNHEIADPQYVKNLREFVERSQNAFPPITRLGLDSEPTTQTPSEAQTLNSSLIYYHGVDIGKGGFGKAHIVIRARDGMILAAKTFKPQSNKRTLDAEDPMWLMEIRREYTLMKENPHVRSPQMCCAYSDHDVNC